MDVEDKILFRKYVELSAKQRSWTTKCQSNQRELNQKLLQITNSLSQIRTFPVTNLSKKSTLLYSYDLENCNIGGFLSCRRIPARARFHTLAEIERCINNMDAIHTALQSVSPSTNSIVDRIVDAMIEVSRDRESEKTKFTHTIKRPRGKDIPMITPTNQEQKLLESLCSIDQELKTMRKDRKRVADLICEKLEKYEDGTIRYIDLSAPEIPEKEKDSTKALTARIQDPDNPSERIRFKVAIVPQEQKIESQQPQPQQQLHQDPSNMWMSRREIPISTSLQLQPGVRSARVKIENMRSVVIESLSRIIPATVRAQDDKAAILWLQQNRDRVIENIASGIQNLMVKNQVKLRSDSRSHKKLKVRKMPPKKNK